MTTVRMDSYAGCLEQLMRGEDHGVSDPVISVYADGHCEMEPQQWADASDPVAVLDIPDVPRDLPEAEHAKTARDLGEVWATDIQLEVDRQEEE